MRMRTHERGEYEIVRVWLLGGFRVSVGSRTIGEDRRQRRKAALVTLLALATSHRCQGLRAAVRAEPCVEKP